MEASRLGSELERGPAFCTKVIAVFGTLVSDQCRLPASFASLLVEVASVLEDVCMLGVEDVCGVRGGLKGGKRQEGRKLCGGGLKERQDGKITVEG
jgi:hypothetical protein